MPGASGESKEFPDRGGGPAVPVATIVRPVAPAPREAGVIADWLVDTSRAGC
jgi:hypothetical protein